MEKKALGRGLEALLPGRETSGRKPGSEAIQMVPVDQIIPNKFQPRQIFESTELESLSESIKKNGILQPVLVRRRGDGIFELIAGERRFRAAKLANLDSVPVIVRNSTDHESTILALIENVQRQDLNPMEEARSYTRLMAEFGFTQETLAEKVGKDRSTIGNLVRMVSLPKEIQVMIEDGVLTSGHAKVILSLSGAAKQTALAQRIVREQLSVRATEKLAQKQSASVTKKFSSKTEPVGRSDVRQVEEQLRQHLSTKVRIRQGRRGGEIALSYFSQEDLSRIVDVLLG